jgi:predicted dehydrogenase
MSDTVRLGLVGLGPRGQRGWLETIRLVERAELVAVCDRHPALLAEGAAAAGLPGSRAHRELDDLLARDDLDAVVTAVPPEVQTAVAVPALEAGKHVLCEVPLTYSLEECWHVVLAAERAGRVLALAEQLCHSPFVLAWRDLVASGRLGTITYAEAEYIHGIPVDWYWIDEETGHYLSWDEACRHPRARKTRFWTLSHPAWYNPHSLSPLLRALDDRVVSVVCLGTRAQSSFLPEVPIPDLEAALLKTARDAVIRLANGFIAPTPFPWHWYRVLGTGGDVQTTRKSDTGTPDGKTGLLWLADGDEKSRRDVTWEIEPRPGEEAAARSGHSGLDYFALRDFVDAVLEGGRPAVDVYRAAEIAAVAALAGVSAEEGSTLQQVPDFRPGPARPLGSPP